MAKFLDGVRDRIFKTDDSGEETDELQRDEMLEAELCNFVKGKVEDVRAFASRISHEGIWLTNIAYVLGFNDVFYDTNSRVFRPAANSPAFLRRNKISVNRILPSVQNRASRLTKSPPRYDVRPKSSSEEDRDAARLGIQAITQIWDIQQVNRKRLELVMWVQQCGHAYLKTSWDDTLGPTIKVGKDKDGSVVVEKAGDIRIDVVNAFEIFPDPLAKSMDEITWIVHAKIRPLHYFRDHYENGDQVKSEDVWLTSLQYEYRINSFNNQAGAATGVNSQIKNSAIELSYYEKTTKKHPHGRWIVCAAGKLLKNTILPIDEIPLSKFDDVMVAGKFYSESVITHARPIQDQYNRTVAQRAAWVNRLLTGKMMAPRGSGLTNEALNDQSGEILEYDPVPNASEPKALDMPNIPQYAYQEDDYLIGMMDNIFGLSEPSQGKAPSASFPAIGMQFLVEQDETRIGVITEQHEFAYASVGRHILKFIEKYYKKPRLLKIAGSNMEYTVRSFQGSSIKGNSDVMVIKGSTLPGSKVLKRQEIMNLHQAGYLGDPTDPKVVENVLSMLEYGDIGEAWKDHSLDAGMYKKNIEMIEEGEKPTVSEFDNHAFLIQEYNRYRKSEKFGLMDEETKAILIFVMNEHVESLIELTAPDLNTEGGEEVVEGGAEQNFEEVALEAGADPETGEMEPPPPPPTEEEVLQDQGLGE